MFVFFMGNNGEAERKKKKEMGLMFCLRIKESSVIGFLIWGRKGVFLFLFLFLFLFFKYYVVVENYKNFKSYMASFQRVKKKLTKSQRFRFYSIYRL